MQDVEATSTLPNSSPEDDSVEKLKVKAPSRDAAVVLVSKPIDEAVIPVFKIAITFVKECLWKDQVGLLKHTEFVVIHM